MDPDPDNLRWKNMVNLGYPAEEKTEPVSKHLRFTAKIKLDEAPTQG